MNASRLGTLGLALSFVCLLRVRATLWRLRIDVLLESAKHLLALQLHAFNLDNLGLSHRHSYALIQLLLCVVLELLHSESSLLGTSLLGKLFLCFVLLDLLLELLHLDEAHEP